ncbi:MAG TPA: GNAT family N-acetyltransferase [Bacteroidales bacterium]|nr:GNAT family N-acetyltransferase [Bacteroidales bacterium]HPI68456.1 GNAT family N-acetyltransferase [Bacteroidales bacterium]HPR73528.1 GNAT family N-acetyltransferase [Bacteroidales bacterium]
MIKIEKYHLTRKPSDEEIIQFVDFLHNHLDQFGDSVIDIKKAIDYALSGESGKGGFLLAGYLGNELVCCVVMNRTGMEGYIPENILVYIATHRDHRGKGIGKELLNEAISEAEGNIALHVEPDNPARYLYEKIGFTNKYLEMRLQK